MDVSFAPCVPTSLTNWSLLLSGACQLHQVHSLQEVSSVWRTVRRYGVICFDSPQLKTML